MRTTLGPVVANLLFAGAGVGILAALGVLEYSFGSVVGALGLAFLTGVAAVGVLLLALLVVGVPYSVVTVAMLAVAVAFTGGLASRRLKHDGNRQTLRSSRRLRSISFGQPYLRCSPWCSGRTQSSDSSAPR